LCRLLEMWLPSTLTHPHLSADAVSARRFISAVQPG
jgi:hypothetical protein